MSENTEADPVEAMFKNPRFELPHDGQVVIVERLDGEQKQCEWRNGKMWAWTYDGPSGKEFADTDSIKRWRGCTGFDF